MTVIEQPYGTRSGLWRSSTTSSPPPAGPSLRRRSLVCTRAAERISPSDAATSKAWLFNDYSPDIAEARPIDGYADYDKALLSARLDAVWEVHAQGRWPDVLEFAERVSLPGAVGIAAADAGLTDIVADMIHVLASPEPKKANLAANYVDRRYVLGGWDCSIDALLWHHPGVGPEEYAILLNCTRDYPRAWEAGEERGGRLQRSGAGSLCLGSDRTFPMRCWCQDGWSMPVVWLRLFSSAPL